MRFSLPKPVHGWRGFIGEVGIIVVGVLIALGAEQLVETVNERRIAGETREAIRTEFNQNLTGMALRRKSEPCIARRLSELRQILITWGRTGNFDTPQWVAQAPRTGMSLARYHAAVSAGRLALLPNAEQYQIGVVRPTSRGLRRYRIRSRPYGVNCERCKWEQALYPFPIVP